MPAAAVWVLVLGRQLYEKEEDHTPADPKREGNPARPGNLLEQQGGKQEFSEHRWQFWKERFNVLCEREDLLQETREIAFSAYEKMEKVENEGS